MMEELRQAAKDALGLYSIWIDDEQYDLIINAVLEKVVEIESNAAGDWMQTYTGRKFHPLRPDPDLIFIEDIAHALAMDCRYGGHCIDRLSVAEHSVHICDAILDAGGTDEEAFAGLMHDSPEAYIRDLIRPVKKSVIGYDRIEDRVWRAICQTFRIQVDLPPIVKEFDSRILADEKEQNMAPLKWDQEFGPPLGVKLKFWGPSMAEQVFLDRFHMLEKRRAA